MTQSEPRLIEPESLLAEAVREFWPHAEVVRVRGRRQSDPQVPELDGDVILVHGPGRTSGRLVVPLRPVSAQVRALCRFSSATTARAAAVQVLAATLTGATRGAVLRDRLVVTRNSGDSLNHHLTEVLKQPVTFSISLGTARVNRKPVLQIFNEEGHTIAYAKVGDSEVSRADVTAEADSLRRVGTQVWQSMDAPRLIDFSSWGRVLVLVISALPGRFGQRMGSRGGVPVDAMAELAAAFRDVDRQAGHWLLERREQTQAMTDSTHRAGLLSCIDAMLARDSLRNLDVGSWHGDWTPWNMSWSRGRVQLWDWERFESGVPVGLDEHHFLINAYTQRHGTTPASLAEGLRVAEAAADRRGKQRGGLSEAYLVAVGVRYLSLSDSALGSAIAHRAECVLSLLKERLDLP